MKTSDLLLGAAVVAVGVVVWRTMRPSTAQVPTSGTTSAGSGGGWRDVLSAAAGGFAALGATRLQEAIKGEREWW